MKKIKLLFLVIIVVTCLFFTACCNANKSRVWHIDAHFPGFVFLLTIIGLGCYIILKQRRINKSKDDFINVLFESKSKAMAICTTKIINCNKLFCKMLGYPKNTIINTALNNYLVYCKKTPEFLKHLSLDEKNYKFTACNGLYMQIKKKDTTNIDVIANFYHCVYKKQKAIVVEIQNINFCQVVSDDFIKLKKLYIAVLSNAFIGYFVLNPKTGKLIENNKYFSDLLSLPTDINKNRTSRFIKAQTNFEILSLLNHKGCIKRFPLKIKKYSGEPIWVELSLWEYDSNIHGVIIDISDKVLAKKSLKKANMLANDANKIKSDLLENISHEIRTPVNGILGFCSLLEQTNLDFNQADYLSWIKHTSSQLCKIIDEMLEFHKISTEFANLEIKPFNLFNLLFDIEKKFHNEVSQKKIQLVKYADPELEAEYYGDPAKLNVVLSNLLSNAIKFTDEGSIYVSIEKSKINNQMLDFKVQDTGIGIPAENIDSIFNSFSQIDSSLSRGYGGLGLGLTIALFWIEKMNGKIKVETKINKGSTFVVSIPLVVKSSDKICILIAEDDKITRKVLTAYCKQQNWDVLEAKNGTEAVEKALSNEISFIFMDLNMPNLNGLNATIQIKQIKPLVPVAILSANINEEEKQQVLKAGANSYLTKPISKRGLIEEVYKFINN